MKFGDRLKTLRIEKGLKQEDVANVFFVHRTTYGKWELNKKEPNLETVVKLAKFYHVTTDYLLGLED